MPRGMGALTNPRRAGYNFLYNRTTVSVDDLVRLGSKRPTGATSSSKSCTSCLFTILFIFVFGTLATAITSSGSSAANSFFGLTFIVAIIYGLFVLAKHFNPQQQAARKALEAKRLYEKRNFDGALSLAKEAALSLPNEGSILFLIGCILHDADRYTEAIEYLIKALAAAKNPHSSPVLLANCYYKTGQYDSAIAVAQGVSEDSDEFVKAIEIVAGCFAQQNKIDLAIESLKKAPLNKRNLTEELKEVHYNLAKLYQLQGDVANALKHLRKVYACDIHFRDVGDLIAQMDIATKILEPSENKLESNEVEKGSNVEPPLSTKTNIDPNQMK